MISERHFSCPLYVTSFMSLTIKSISSPSFFSLSLSAAPYQTVCLSPPICPSLFINSLLLQETSVEILTTVEDQRDGTTHYEQAIMFKSRSQEI